MVAWLTFTERLKHRAVRAAKPVLARWDSLSPQQRTNAALVATFVFAVFILAFVVLPAMNSRLALTGRIPQMESQLALMRSHAVKIAALAKEPIAASAPRVLAGVASLQLIFGPAAQISTVPDGFRVVMPATEYASWWDKTSQAITSYALVLGDTSLVRTDGATTATVAVDMRLVSEAGTSAPPVTPTSQGK